MNSLCKQSDKCLLNKEFFKDLDWWLQFLEVFNGQCPFHDSRPITNLHTDACSSGIGAVFGEDWFYSNLLVDAPELAPLHINFKEALCIVFALRRWAPFLRDKTINIFCDNTAAVAMLNKGTTRNRVMMDYLRQLFWYSATYNFRLKVFHIPGKFNVWADHVSRLHQEEHFLALCQHQLSRFGPSALNSPATCHMSQLSYLFLLGLFGSGFYSHSAF